MPVVANGQVCVAAYQSLMIFGPNTRAVSVARTATDAATTAEPATLPAGITQRVTEMLLAINGKSINLRTRGRQQVTLDISPAMESEQVASLKDSRPYTALAAETGPAGALQAVCIARAKRGVRTWPQDQL